MVRRIGCAIQALLPIFLATTQGTEVCFCSFDEDGTCVECAHGDDHALAADDDSSTVHIEAAECNHLKIEMPDVGPSIPDLSLSALFYLAPPYPDELVLVASPFAYVPPCATSPPDPGGRFVDYSVRALLRS